MDVLVEVALGFEIVDDRRPAPHRPVVLADQDLGVRRIHRDGIADVLRPDARIARHRAAQRDEVVQQRAGILRHVEHAELGIKHVHLGRRLGLRRQLKHDPDAVDRVLLDRLDDRPHRRDQARRAARHAFAEAGIDLAARPAWQHGTELELRAAHHRQAGQHVLARHRFHEAGRRDHRHLACLDVGLVDHAAHAAVVVDMAVSVDHGHHGPLRPVGEVMFQCRPGNFGRRQRIDQDQPAVALDHRHVGDVEAAQLIEAVGDHEQAVGHVEPGHAPQARVHRVGRQLAIDEGIFAKIPQYRAAGRAHHAVRHRRDQTLLRRLEIADVGKRQRRRHGGVRGFGRGFGVARGVEVRRGNRNGGRYGHFLLFLRWEHATSVALTILPVGR